MVPRDHGVIFPFDYRAAEAALRADRVCRPACLQHRRLPRHRARPGRGEEQDCVRGIRGRGDMAQLRLLRDQVEHRIGRGDTGVGGVQQTAGDHFHGHAQQAAPAVRK